MSFRRLVLVLFLAMIAMAILLSVPLALTENRQAAAPELPNPASAFCKQQGFTLEIRSAGDGSQAGVCVFPDGSECDEWAFFRGECGPSSEISLSQP